MPSLHHSDENNAQAPLGPNDDRQQPLPPVPTDWPAPKLRLIVKDLSTAGSAIFFTHIHPTMGLRNAVSSVLKTLYTLETCPRNVRSVTLYLEDMDGVAYTKGSDLDNDHKELHFSTRHIENSKQRAKDEIMGVIVHEMVHCFQYNAKGSCPGGLIEGIADYVRLKAGLSPPHWKRGGNRWDEGYQTTGYFLEWAENTYAGFSVKKLNEAMKDRKYQPDVWKELTGQPVDDLWNVYKASL